MDRKPKLLMELRTCFEGFAGIPQETRLLFSSFLDMPSIEVHGLINHTGQKLARALKGPPGSNDRLELHRRFDRLSRFVVSTTAEDRKNIWNIIARELSPGRLALRSLLGLRQAIDTFEGSTFENFVWDTFFAPTLPTDEVAKVSSATYRTLPTPWRAMHRTGLMAKGLFGYPTVDTSGYEFFLSQTPYPARMAPGTQLLVRYHDAIPIFLPHTIPAPRFHRLSHLGALRENMRSGIFVCTSNAVRGDLLRLFPQLESRSPVIHDIVSHNYFLARDVKIEVAEIIRSRLDKKTAPKLSVHRQKAFYDQHLKGDPRFLLMVSSVEPRKNHVRLLRAWESVRLEHPGLKLIVVGSLGWDTDKMLAAFRPWQDRGELFHLSSVPANDLRVLFGRAECVICPSVAEGFDLSGVEAMLCGGAVAASDIPVHREVYGDAARYFSPLSVKEMAHVIGGIIRPDAKGERDALIQRGLAHAKQYTREAIAPRWAALFDRIRGGDYAARR